jgi:hypothetical protein
VPQDEEDDAGAEASGVNTSMSLPWPPLTLALAAYVLTSHHSIWP